MNKIVYNNCYGGFNLSDKAMQRYCEIKGIKVYPENWAGLTLYWLSEPTGDKVKDDWRETFDSRDIPRHDPVLVQIVEELGKEANGQCAELRIFETESNQYMIEEYDGNETVVVSYDDSWIYIK